MIMSQGLNVCQVLQNALAMTRVQNASSVAPVLAPVHLFGATPTGSGRHRLSMPTASYSTAATRELQSGLLFWANVMAYGAAARSSTVPMPARVVSLSPI